MTNPRTEGETGEKLAVYIFPIVIVACAIVAFLSPSTFEPVGQYLSLIHI